MGRVVRARIDCVPTGKGRPRFGGGRTWTPAATVRAEHAQAVLLGPFTPREPFAGDVILRLVAVFPVPASWSKAKQAAALSGHVRPRKPDWDNVGKLTSDVLTRLGWWRDDDQVAEAHVSKVYGTRPGLELEVEEIG